MMAFKNPEKCTLFSAPGGFVQSADDWGKGWGRRQGPRAWASLRGNWLVVCPIALEATPGWLRVVSRMGQDQQKGPTHPESGAPTSRKVVDRKEATQEVSCVAEPPETRQGVHHLAGVPTGEGGGV